MPFINCSRASVSKYVNRFKKGNLINSTKKKRERRSKLTAQQIFKILKYFTHNPFDIASQCRKYLKLDVCDDTILNRISKKGMKTYTA